MKYTGKEYEVFFINDLRHMLEHSAGEYAGKPAFKLRRGDGEFEEVSYVRLKKDVEAFGTALLSLGICPAGTDDERTKIAVISENRYEWCIAYLAAICGAGIAVPLDKELPTGDVANIIKVSDTKVIAYSQKYGELIMAEEELANANLLRINFDLEESSESEMSFKRLLKRGYDLMTSGDADYKSVKIDNEALAAILFTSGTTGMTKGVMLSHKNICSNIMSICKMINVNPDEQFLSILPLHHTYECTIGFLLPLYRGLCISFCRGIRYIAKDILEVRPTVLILVPIIIEGIHDKIIAKTQETSKDARKYKIGMAAATSLLKVGIDIRKKVFKPISAVFGGRLRLLISGASAIKPEVVRDFHMFGLEIHQGYGLTECSPLVAGNADGLITFDTVGTAVPEVEIDIVNKDEKGIGEIICSGPNIMLGYYKNKEQTDKVMIDGWFHTGDLGMYVMEKKQQCLKIAGRLKNVIITKNGENIYPEEVEYYLLSSPIISEAVVFGEEGKNDVVLKAEVYPNFDELAKEMNIDRQNITADQIKNKIGEVIKKINEKMPTYKIIRGFDIRENEFIKTTTQKIIREYKNKKQDK